MAYLKHKFTTGQILEADYLNEMEDGIEIIESELETVKSSVSEKHETLNTKISSMEQQLSDLLYKPIQINGFSSNMTTVEMGKTVNSVTLNWVLNKTPTTLTLNGEVLDPELRTKKLDNLNIVSEMSFTLTAKDERGATANSTTAINFMNGVYYGAKVQPETVDSAFILSLTKNLTSTKSRTITVNDGEGQYIWYAVPSRFGTCTFKVGGFEGGFACVAVIEFTNAFGYTESYDVYRSSNTGLGNTTVEVK